MNAGQLRDRIVIQTKTSTSDGFGQPIYSWTTHLETWANVLFQNGKEFISAGKEQAELSASMRIRYRTDITTQMRVLFEGQLYNIKAILPDRKKKEFIDIAVTVGADEG